MEIGTEGEPFRIEPVEDPFKREDDEPKERPQPAPVERPEKQPVPEKVPA